MPHLLCTAPRSFSAENLRFLQCGVHCQSLDPKLETLTDLVLRNPLPVLLRRTNVCVNGWHGYRGLRDDDRASLGVLHLAAHAPVSRFGICVAAMTIILIDGA